MRSLSRMAAHLGATIMILMVPAAVGAEDLVPLQPMESHASQGATSAVSLPGHLGCHDDQPHPYAVFWRGFCLCESIREQAKLDRFRYPDYLRHRRYVAAREAIPLGHRLATSHGDAGYGHCDQCSTPRVRTRLLGWLSRILHLGRNRHQVVSVHDAVVTKSAETAVDHEPAATQEDTDTSTIEFDRDLMPPVEPAPTANENTAESSPAEIDRNGTSFLDPGDVPVFLPPKPVEVGPAEKQTIAFPVPSARDSHETTPPPGANADVPRPPRNKPPKASPAAPRANDSTSNDEFGHLFD